MILAVAGLAVVVGAIVPWAESEKELAVLCGGFRPGAARADVIRTLETLAWSRWGVEDGEAEATIIAHGPGPLTLSSCRVETAEGVVASRVYGARVRLVRAAGWTAATGLLSLSVFQVALALGAPLGHMAWGGRTPRLPIPLRAASLLSAALLAVAVPCALELGGIASTLGRRNLAQGIVGLLTVVFALGVVGNALSGSRAERRVMTPFALLLTGACLGVLLAG